MSPEENDTAFTDAIKLMISLTGSVADHYGICPLCLTYALAEMTRVAEKEGKVAHFELTPDFPHDDDAFMMHDNESDNCGCRDCTEAREREEFEANLEQDENGFHVHTDYSGETTRYFYDYDSDTYTEVDERGFGIRPRSMQ